MTGKGLGGIIASVIAIVLACTAGGVLLFGGGAAARCAGPLPSGATAIPTPTRGWPAVAGYTTEQVTNAATITTVSADKRVPVRGWIIAVATAIQESSLRNLPDGPDDSIGLFQPRPSQGWGTPAQLRDPAYAAGKFYDKLLTIAGWQQMPLAKAAQAVQRSSYPDKYAEHETDAVALVAAITRMPIHDVVSGFGRALPGGVEQCVSSLGWALPAPGPIVSGWRTTGRPAHAGVDIGAPRGTTIRAAAAGTVVTVRCNVSEGTCDTDGSPSVKGCGYYVDIDHGQGVTTRYCHQLRRPSVQVGQRVAAGQPIGLVGSSGNSSGPHLHFEVRLNSVDTNPVPFLAARGVRIGQPVSVVFNEDVAFLMELSPESFPTS